MSDLPESTLCPSLSLSFTVSKWNPKHKGHVTRFVPTTAHLLRTSPSYMNMNTMMPRLRIPASRPTIEQLK